MMEKITIEIVDDGGSGFYASVFYGATVIHTTDTRSNLGDAVIIAGEWLFNFTRIRRMETQDD
jgi:hypothetical protein